MAQNFFSQKPRLIYPFGFGSAACLCISAAIFGWLNGNNFFRTEVPDMNEVLNHKIESQWDIVDVLAKEMNIRRDIVINVMTMIEKDECTIPFIARYRKERTNAMDPDSIRKFVELLNELRNVQKKSVTMIKSIEKQGKLDVKIESALLSAQTMDELDHVYTPFKGEKKSSLANRARAIGLDEVANAVLSRPNEVNLKKWVMKGTEGRSTLFEVEKGVGHIISDIISKDKSTMDKIRDIFQPRSMTLESKVIQAKGEKNSGKERKKDKETKPNKEKITKSDEQEPHGSKDDADKYHNFFNFTCRLPLLKSYQVLAINRGETKKHLNVKIIIDEPMETKFLNWCKRYWCSKCNNPEVSKLCKHAVEDSFSRLIKPFIVRKAKSDLTKQANKDAVDVFTRNLKKLLLTPPLRGKVVLGVDPGYRNGCKCAVISSVGDVLMTDTFYLHSERQSYDKVKRMLHSAKFNVIAIGNGTACRETETFVSDFISRNRSYDLAYCIVNENGASIYSVTPDAKEELPDLKPEIRSAVSIARRLQDPLVELVKIEPKHIGVGMYQHDIPECLLKAALNCVIEDCVTYVGVDLNVATVSLLRHIAGLKVNQAKNIVAERKKSGPFVNRKQLLSVKGIGEKTFQQCVGFIRINQKCLSQNVVKQEKVEVNDPETDNVESEKPKVGQKRKGRPPVSKVKKKVTKTDWTPNPLDQTWIHTESYEKAEELIKKLHLKAKDVGKYEFISVVKRAMYESGVKKLANDLSVGIPTMQLIVDGLSQSAGYCDIRSQMRRPLFRKGVYSMSDLRVGSQLTGRITNVADFGIFVDIGVGRDGLIHLSNVGGRWEELKQCIGPNDTVEVRVLFIDIKKSRIELRLVHADIVRTGYK